MRILLLSLCLLFVGCSVYTPREMVLPDEAAGWPGESEAPVSGRWWTGYELPALDRYMDSVLARNSEMEQAWRRLDQAVAASVAAGSAARPQATVAGSGSRAEGENDVLIPGFEFPEEQYGLSLSLSYELDLWKRIQSRKRAGSLRAEASRADVEATALVLSGTAVELWLSLLEQQARLDLLAKQVRTAATTLELVELRFDTGAATALAVYQQREQLAALKAQEPMMQAQREALMYQLNVLRGAPPGAGLTLGESRLPEALPEELTVPDLNGLIAHRPDLRAMLRRIMAAEYDVAVAVAERYPRLTLSLDEAFSSVEVSDLFDRETTTIAGEIFAPLLDGGARRAEVDRRKAASLELMAMWNGSLLNALKEVQEALSREKHLGDSLARLNEQYEAAQASAREARSRYSNGLSDYLPVVSAVQNVQQLEHRLIADHAEWLRNRARLYRACGGDWTSELIEGEQ